MNDIDTQNEGAEKENSGMPVFILDGKELEIPYFKVKEETKKGDIEDEKKFGSD